VRTTEGATVGALRLTLNGANQSGFIADDELGGLPATNVAGALGAGIVGTHSIAVSLPGLAPDAPAAGDTSALDDEKIADILLYVETQVTA
jgi:hypothetical protein